MTTGLTLDETVDGTMDVTVAERRAPAQGETPSTPAKLELRRLLLEPIQPGSTSADAPPRSRVPHGSVRILSRFLAPGVSPRA